MFDDDFMKMLEEGMKDTDPVDSSDMRQKRDANSDRLKLFIGIGGSGCSAVVKAREIASRKLKKEYSAFLKYLVLVYTSSESESLMSQGIDVLDVSSYEVQVPLQDKVAEYFAGDWSNMKTYPLDVMIFTGISGGTGSGLFLDVVEMIKKVCPSPSNVKLYLINCGQIEWDQS